MVAKLLMIILSTIAVVGFSYMLVASGANFMLVIATVVWTLSLAIWSMVALMEVI